ncbi:MAG TPA: hypothetical protein VHF46_07505 [Rubrobacteraceae bacterium]|nr:hypothetical protein [Rubrobacteraceae bacterium]
MTDETQNPAAAGDVEIDIDLLERLEKYNEILKASDKQTGTPYFSKNQREELLRKYKEYDTELEGKGYEELASIYKEVVKDTIDYKLMHGDDPTWIDKHDLKTDANKDTPEELKAEIREAMRTRDFGRVFEQNQEYHKELADSGTETYEQLADYYKNLMGAVYHDNFPTGTDFERWYEQTDLKSYKHLDTPGELKAALRDLMTTRDEKVEEWERKQIEEDIEMPSDSDEQTWWGTNEDEAPPVDKPDASSATEWAEPLLGSEAAPIEGEASSRLMGGGGEASPTEDLTDKAFARDEEGEGAPDAAHAQAGDADKLETSPDSVGHPIIGSFKDVDTQDVQGEAPIQKEAQEYQGIDTQEQSTFEAVPEQSAPNTEAQWSVDQDELLNPYEDDPSSIPEDQLLNPYEDDPVVDP